MKLIDISEKMPRHGPVWTRPVDGIDTVVVHHSGAAGAAGEEGAINSAEYSISVAKKLEAERRQTKPRYKYPYPTGPSYTFWIPSNQPVWGDRVVYQTNPLDAWTMHSNKLNKRAVAVCLQGNHQKETNPRQYEALNEVLLLWHDELDIDLDRMVGHCELHLLGGDSKPSCPGPGPMEVLKKFRST